MNRFQCNESTLSLASLRLRGRLSSRRGPLGAFKHYLLTSTFNGVHCNVHKGTTVISQTYITATSARNNFFELLEKIKKGPYPINITVKGVPEAVIMSKEDYDSWVATYETLADPELMESIRKGEEDIKSGRYVTWEELKKELGLDVPGEINKPGKKRSKTAR